MHVCLVGMEYPKETSFGGIATYQYLLAHELVKNNINVTVICGTSKNDYDYYEDGIHVIRIHTVREAETLDTFDRYRKKITELINKINEKEKIDIIESPEFSGEIIDYQKQRKIPIVIKLHTSYNIWSILNDISFLEKELQKKVVQSEDIVLKHADKIISCSNILKGIMPKYHQIDVNKIDVVPNMIDISSFYPLDNNHQSNKILYCGAIEKRKGVYVLAKAIPIVLDKVSEAIFEFIGEDSKVEENGLTIKENLLNMIPKKYHSNIEFLGHKNNDELNSYYNEARIGVIPSLFDNFPYVALEELLTEMPLVASKNTGIREMIENNKSGMLYNEKDHEELAKIIIELYLDKEKSIQLGKNGRKEVIRKYSPEVICEKMINIYKGVIYEFNK